MVRPVKNRADTAGDVETNASCGDYTAFIGVEGGDTADRETVAPVGIGHSVGGFYNAGKSGDIDTLLVDLVIELFYDCVVTENDKGDEHISKRLDAPLETGTFFEFIRVHNNLAPYISTTH